MAVRVIERKPPRGLSRLLWRLPILFFRLRLNFLFAGRILLLAHTGRTSGLQRRCALEVVDYNESTDSYFVVSAWGEKADWVKNVRVRIGQRDFAARATILAPG